jgi:tRNA (guanosine-2'-O-)-methyltransferase
MNERRRELIDRYYRNKIQGAELLLDNVWDPHNVAAILRSVDGFGISRVNLYYTVEQYPEIGRSSSKSSASATKWVRCEKVDDLAAFAEERKSDGYRFVGADRTDSAVSLVDYRFSERSIVVMGSEHHGLQSETRAVIDDYVYIPMTGMVESYNVSVAAAVIMYELHRQKGHDLLDRGKLGVSGGRA